MNGIRKLRLVVLISGRGSNLQALLDQSASGELSAEVAAVISNQPGVYGLERARQASAGSGRAIQCGGQAYELIDFLGTGQFSEVHPARRLGTHSLLATIKLSSNRHAAERFRCE